MFKLDKSEKAQRILKAVFDEIEIQEDRPMIKIPLKNLKGFDYNEIIGAIKKIKDTIIQLNEGMQQDLLAYDSGQCVTKNMGDLMVSKGINTKKQYLDYHDLLNENDIKNYLIIKVIDRKKFENRQKTTNNYIAKIKKGESDNRNIIEVVEIGGDIKMQIEKYHPITFKGDLRCNLIKFFYYNRDTQKWYDYADIQNAFDTSGDVSSKIRHEIERINDRVYRCTDGTIDEIIERKKDDSYGLTSPYLYRWK